MIYTFEHFSIPIYIFFIECEALEVGLSSTNPSIEANSTLGSVFAKPDLGARPKITSYPQNRRPAGGLSRPLPSPGNRHQFSEVVIHYTHIIVFMIAI